MDIDVYLLKETLDNRKEDIKGALKGLEIQINGLMLEKAQLEARLDELNKLTEHFQALG